MMKNIEKAKESANKKKSKEILAYREGRLDSREKIK